MYHFVNTVFMRELICRRSSSRVNSCRKFDALCIAMLWSGLCTIPSGDVGNAVSLPLGTMGEDRKASKLPRTEDIIAAFDRERAQAQELRRRHLERVRASLTHDCTVNHDAVTERD